MGILSTILGADNPIAQWTAQNRNLLNQWGAGIGSGTDLGEGFANAARLGPAGAQADAAYAASQEAEAKRQEQINATTQYLQAKFPDLASAVSAGMPLDSAWNEAMKRSQPGYGQQAQADLPASVQEYKFYSDQTTAAGQTPLPYDEWRKGSNQTVRAGLGQPIPMRNKTTGEYAPFQPMSDGTMINTLTGQPANDKEWTFDPSSVTADKARVTVDEKAAGAARQALPAAEGAYEMTTKAVEAILGDEKGQAEQFGQNPLLPRNLYVMGGSPMANMQNQMKQLTGQAFLQIRQALKGAGQVTDYEGQRGEAAISRAQAAFESGDQKAFQQAIIEFKDAMDRGMQLLRAQANGGYSAGSPAVTGASNASNGWKVVGVR